MLSDEFAGWLRAVDVGHNDGSGLQTSLSDAGLQPEADLFEAYLTKGQHRALLPSGPNVWDGRAVHIGPALPVANPGELWFDTVEMTLSALLPGDPLEEFEPAARHRWLAYRNWLALRPVAGWQYAGFLGAASIDTPRISTGLRLLDPLRLLPSRETSPVVAAAPVEILAYLRWFGKRTVDREDWLDAVTLFGHREAQTLWTPGTREWAGGITDLEMLAAIEPTEIGDDDRDVLDNEEELEPDSESRRLFELYEVPPCDAAFRSAVDPQYGLFAVPVAWLGLVLRDVARR